jgi:hypothetical protein
MALGDFGHTDPALTLRKESAKVKESKSERVEIGKLKLENGKEKSPPLQETKAQG